MSSWLLALLALSQVPYELLALVFYSTLSSHVFKNRSHKILFEESALVSDDQGIN